MNYILQGQPSTMLSFVHIPQHVLSNVPSVKLQYFPYQPLPLLSLLTGFQLQITTKGNSSVH